MVHAGVQGRLTSYIKTCLYTYPSYVPDRFVEPLLTALRAAGEHTRLRLLALLRRAELTVSELTRILGQSQPRVSRHLKLLCDAGLLERSPEGAWVFYRLADHGLGAQLARTLLELVPANDAQLGRDLQRLDTIIKDHAAAAAEYFRRNATDWDSIRSLYVPEAKVEQAMLEALNDKPIEELLDLGTGTGRILQVFASHIKRGLGIDSSREMLAVARANLEALGLRHCQVRHGDIYNLPIADASVDAVTIHQVLHFLDNPAAAVLEAARTLKPGGRLLIVDFARHQLEFLRTEFAHRRLGFTDDEVMSWCRAAGLVDPNVRHLSASAKSADKLTVSLWTSIQSKRAPSRRRPEAA
jgi:ubiquinone/menaquinone biosynthesis C-methylase UbiE/DNA-binding MarR family transcriptional regulator